MAPKYKTLPAAAAANAPPDEIRELIAQGCDVNAVDAATQNTALHYAAAKRNLEVVTLLLDAGATVDARTKNGKTPLHNAAELGEIAIVRLLVERGANVLATFDGGSSVIMHASARGHMEVVKFCLDQGADPNAARENGTGLLFFAAENSRTAIMDLLLERGADVHARTKAGSSILYNAAGKGHVEGVRWALDHGVDPNIARADGISPLHYAAEQGQIAVMQLLAERGANVNIATKLGSRIIQGAAGKGQVEAVKWGIDHGIAVDTTNNNGYTPLLFAAEKGQVGAMRLLVERGANVHAHTKTGRSLVHCAVASGSMNVIEYALELGVDLAVTLHDNGYTALHNAAMAGNVPAMKLLVDHGADHKALSKTGSSILYPAAGKGKVGAVKYAIELGIDPAAPRTDGYTALHYAAEEGQAAMMRVLVNSGAKIQAKTKIGASVLHCAANKGQVEAARCAIDLGVNPNVTRNDGVSALHLAADNGHIAVMQLLVERGTNIHIVTKLGSPVIHGASGKGQLAAVKWALDHGVKVDTTNKNGYSSLLFAAEKGQVEAMRLLIERGADVQARAKNGRSLVFCAVVSGNVDAVRVALEYGVTIDKTTNEKNYTALHQAAEAGDVTMMRFLVDQGANLHAVTKDGSSVLDVALASEKSEAAKLAIDMGLGIPETGADGWSAFHTAAKKGDIAMMKMYIDHGGKIDAVTDLGRTALHVAALQGTLEAVKFAIDLGLDIKQADLSEYTPLHCAAKSGNVQVIDYLIQKGADLHAKAHRDISVLHSAVRSEKVEAVAKVLDLGLPITTVDQNGGSALHYAADIGAVAVMKLLVERSATVDARTKSGRSILHSAVDKGRLQALQYALTLAVNVNASAKTEWETALYATTQVEDHKLALQLAFELCTHGAEWSPECQQHLVDHAVYSSDAKEKDAAAQWHSGLAACLSHWVNAHRTGSHIVAEIPVEVVERGAESVKTFVDDVARSNVSELVYRCKVCVLGPTGWGKTSLIRSLKAMEPALTNEEPDADGIELLSSVFTEEREGKPNRRLDVTFWDFPGQDVHQLAHSLFFSSRTLFVVAVDLPAYVRQLQNTDGLSDDQCEDAMDRFVNTNVFRWLRTILNQQPDAHILLAGTKKDSLEDPEANEADVRIDLLDRLETWKVSYVQELQSQLRSASDAHGGMHRTSSFLLDPEDQTSGAFEKLKKKLMGVGEWLPVSCSETSSIQSARQKVQELLADKEVGFPMWKTYTQVYATIQKWCAEGKAKGSESEYIKAAIVRLSVLRKQLMREVDGLNRADCDQIIRSLDDLGDVLWFEHEDAGELNDYVILDPKLGIDIVSEVINHDFSKDPKGPPQDGLVRHSRLCTFPWWRELSMELTHSFKALLQYFHLAFPAENEEMLPESDIIVPAFWKAYPSASSRSLMRQQSKLDYIAKNRWCWEYEVPAGVAASIYEQLAVQTSTSYLKRAISDNCIECACDEFASRISLMEGEGKTDVVRIEVAGEGAEMSWHNMRYYLMKMEKVLEGYPGMTSRRYVVDTARGQLIENRYPLDPAVKKLTDAIALGRDEQSLRVDIPWFPADMNWYIRKSWKDIGSFQQLQLDQLVRDKLEVLRKLAIAGDAPRRYPALWSFEYRASERKVILRMSSDLSGRCFHVPIEIEANPEFLGKYGGIIKEGLSVCSGIVAAAIPLPFIQNVIDAAMSVYDTKVEETKQVHSLIDRLDMAESNKFDSRTTALSPGAATAVLRDVLKFHNDGFDDLEISDLTNLELAVTSTGEYVWAHAHEIAMLKDKITRCASPPSTWADIEDFNKDPSPESSPTAGTSPSAAGATSSPKSTSPTASATTTRRSSSSSTAPVSKGIAASLPSAKISFCISSVSGLAPSDWYKVYCKWQISYGKSLAPLASGATGQNTDGGSEPTWRNIKIALDTITSVEMLRECRLLVRVKRRSRFGWTKLFGGQEVQLCDYINADAVQNFHCDPIDIAIDDATPSKQWATVEFFCHQ